MLSRRKLLQNSLLASASLADTKHILSQAPAPKATHRIHQSVSRWCYAKIPLEDLCRASASIGLEGIDLLKSEEFEIPARFGLRATMGYAGGGDIKQGLNRTENHAAIEAGLRKYVPLAAKAGVPNVITFSGLRAPDLTDEQGARNTVLGLQRVRSIVEDHGVDLCMELLNSKRDHPGYMCDHTAWGVRVVEEVASPRVKLLYDIYHMQIMEGDLVSTITANARWLGHFHTGGVPGRHELDDTQEVTWPAVMRAIAATGFTGYVAHEFVPREDPLTSLRAAFNLCNT